MIYVDALRNWGWKLGQSCHLFTEPGNLDALHTFAARVGLRRSWFQSNPGKMPHYDLTSPRRDKAVAIGAVEVSRRKTVEVMRRWRTTEGLR